MSGNSATANFKLVHKRMHTTQRSLSL